VLVAGAWARFAVADADLFGRHFHFEPFNPGGGVATMFEMAAAQALATYDESGFCAS
jgi:hypothetical protein